MSAPTADEALPLLLARSSDRPAQLRAVAVPSALSSSRPPDIPTDAVRRPSTPSLAATSRHLLGSRPPATSPRSRRSPPRRGRGLRIIIVAGDALLLHDAADHDVNVRPVPVTPAAAMAPVNVSVMTIRRGTFTAAAHCTSNPSAAPLRHRTACRARRARRRITLVAGDPLRAGMPLHIRLPGAGFARHRLPHFTVLQCPRLCHRLCPSLRLGAPHDCLKLRLHPPLNRCGRSLPRASPASFPLRSYSGF